jgi:phage/plasmid-like protein (TIGR03299 family)
MPDNIAVASDGQHMMAYQGEMPWHTFGTKLDSITSVEQALDAARLTWTVECRSMFIAENDVKDGDVTRAAGDFYEVPNRRAVVRLSDRQILGTVGMNYTCLQNSEAFAVLEVVCAEHGVTIETAGALGKGERVWMLGKLPRSAEVVPGDRVEAYVLVLTGHDGATPNTGRLTNVRVVCANTLAIAVAGMPSMYRISHSRRDKAVLLQEAQQLITNLTRQFNLSLGQMQRLAAFELNALELGRYVDAVLQIDNLDLASKRIQVRRQQIVDLAFRGKGAELAPQTMWTAYNAFTEYVDHVQPAQASAAKRRRANENALFGSGALLKARALDIALKEVRS